MRSVVLTGFMGAGKTSVGRALAFRTGMTFVDTDEVVESLAGKQVAEVFADDGESRFRDLEHLALRDALHGGDAVISTGGGALVAGRNLDLLGPTDRVITLHADVHELARRISAGPERPLMADPSPDRIAQLIASRADAYDRFERVETTGRQPSDVAAGIAAHLHLQDAAGFEMGEPRTSCVLVEMGLLGAIDRVLDRVPPLRQVVVVTDENIQASGISAAVTENLNALGADVRCVVLPPGEEHKTLGTLEHLYSACLEARLERSATIVGLGGGVVCDIAALLAATYLRGLHLVLAPTTLLAQVDAAIGGKAGIDFRGVKNMIGAFYPASAVLIDPAVLQTLSPDRLSEGLAEVLKIAAIRDADLYRAVTEMVSPQAILDRPDIIRRAAVDKAHVVQEDPLESGVRGLLNFGHTIGHGIEAAGGFALGHGEAVAVGMVAEARLAVDLGICDPSFPPELAVALQRFALPTSAPGLDPADVLSYMKQDKKRAGGAIRFALPTGLGTGDMVAVDEGPAVAAIRYAVGGAT